MQLFPNPILTQNAVNYRVAENSKPLQTHQ